MEKYYEYDKDLYMIFIDFKQTYDSINRNQQWIALDSTKFMIVTRKPTVMQSLRVGQYLFEQVGDFKYLGVNINQRNDMHNEVMLRLASANRGYHTMRSMLSSRLLSRETKTFVRFI